MLAAESATEVPGPALHTLGQLRRAPCSLSYVAPPLHNAALATLKDTSAHPPAPWHPSLESLARALLSSPPLPVCPLPTLWPQRASFRLPGTTDSREGEGPGGLQGVRAVAEGM